MHCSFYVLHKLSMTCFILCDSVAKGVQSVLIYMYSEMQVILYTHFRLVNTHICYNLLLLLPAAWEILVYEVTCFFVCLFVFFASVWVCNHLILCQNRMFSIDDTKMRPRLKTASRDWNRRISVLYLFTKSLWITIISKLCQFYINCASFWCIYCNVDMGFKLFDMHTRDVYGRGHPQGTHKLLEALSLDRFVYYFQSIHNNDKFEVKGHTLMKFKMAQYLLWTMHIRAKFQSKLFCGYLLSLLLYN